MSIFRAFSARFGSIFGKVYENSPKAFSAKFRAYYTGPSVTCSCIHQSPGHRACRVQLTACLTFFGCRPVTRVELELNLGVKVVACWRGDQVIWARAGARDRLFNHVRLGIKEERCIAAFSDQNQSTQRPKDYNIWANRSHPCFLGVKQVSILTNRSLIHNIRSSIRIFRVFYQNSKALDL